MTGGPSNSKPQETLLSTIGRTLVHYQHLEHWVKRASRLAPLEGTIPKLRHDREKRDDRLDRSTLGLAMADWFDVLDEQPARHSGTDDLLEPVVKLEFKIPIGIEERSSHKEALENLLKQRNDFIHSALLGISWDSESDHQELIDSLKNQIILIREQIDLLLQVLSQVNDAINGIRGIAQEIRLDKVFDDSTDQ